MNDIFNQGALTQLLVVSIGFLLLSIGLFCLVWFEWGDKRKEK